MKSRVGDALLLRQYVTGVSFSPRITRIAVLAMFYAHPNADASAAFRFTGEVVLIIREYRSASVTIFLLYTFHPAARRQNGILRPC